MKIFNISMLQNGQNDSLHQWRAGADWVSFTLNFLADATQFSDFNMAFSDIAQAVSEKDGRTVGS